MKDISDFYSGHRAYDEEISWILSRQYKRHLEFSLPKIAEHGIKSAIEWGCGTGLLAAELPNGINYTGIDRNLTFLELARKRCQHQFFDLDVRRCPIAQQRDLSMAWTFFKHFGLHEWDEILTKILKAGRHAAFNVMILGEDFDNGTEYHHVHVREARVQGVIEAAGYEILHRTISHEWEVPDKGTAKDVMLWASCKG